MVWIILITVVAIFALIVAAIRANKTNRLPVTEQKKLRKLMMEIQSIGSPDPKDFPW